VVRRCHVLAALTVVVLRRMVLGGLAGGGMAGLRRVCLSASPPGGIGWFGAVGVRGTRGGQGRQAPFRAGSGLVTGRGSEADCLSTCNVERRSSCGQTRHCDQHLHLGVFDSFNG